MYSEMIGPTIHPGIELYQKQNYSAAESELEAATRTRPTWAEGWRYLGFCQYGLGKAKLAAVTLERAIAMEPNHAEGHYGLGLVRAAQNKTDEALACFEDSLRLNSGHAAAKHALICGLIFRGQKRIEDRDFERGEKDLDRAIKLDRSNPAPVLALAKYFLAYNQEGRAAKVVSDGLASIADDAELNALGTQLNVKAKAAAVVAQQQAQTRQVVQQSQEVPCPSCKQPIMPWAVTCPHCMTQLKARPTSFDHLKGGPSTTWQEVTYYVVSALWLLDGCRPLLVALLFSKSAILTGFVPILVAVGAVKVAIALGLLFRVEWLQFLAKIFCIIDILLSGYGVILSMALSQWGGFAINLISLVLTCLLLYLISFMDG